MANRPGSKSALVVVDVQVGVVRTAWQRDRIVSNVSLAVERARQARVPVVWVQHHGEELERDTPDWSWVPELQPLSHETLIHKEFNSAFEETDLAVRLDELGVSRVFLAGAATNWCIRATAYAALERGFDVTLLADAHTTEDMEIAPGHVVEARAVIDDLNTAMRWLRYPGRGNAIVNVSDASFSVA